jgi:hypothetical protein
MNRFCTKQINYKGNLFVVEVKLFGVVTIKSYKFKQIEKAITKLIEL